jgi:hypothetical protein
MGLKAIEHGLQLGRRAGEIDGAHEVELVGGIEDVHQGGHVIVEGTLPRLAAGIAADAAADAGIRDAKFDDGVLRVGRP